MMFARGNNSQHQLLNNLNTVAREGMHGCAFETVNLPVHNGKPPNRSLPSCNVLNENEKLKKMLACAEERAEINGMKMKLMKQDIFRLNTAYGEKCRESKKLRDDISKLQAQWPNPLHQDLRRLQEAYATKAEDNRRLGETIDALVEDRHEMQSRISL